MSTLSKQAQAIFLAAVEQPAGNRPGLLDKECGNDLLLRKRVEALLNAHDDLGSFLEPAPVATLLSEPPPSEPVPLGATIGSYKLREVLGEGGMGIVYVAEQERPIRRKVALKVIKPGMDSKEIVGRFEAERQALALMDHPNIAKVHDAGTTETGRPYFVMELVRGMPITDYCDRCKLPPRERIKLFITVCQAIQHAHQRGIIHRDLKPSNVLITLHDGTPIPKVIDFGVAKAVNQKLTEQTLYTRHAQMVGTPLYMSPEQAELSGLEIDTRSDVYSLGVLLYELLTGHTPFDKETFSKVGYDEMRRMIREDEPPRPSHRVSTLAAEARSTVSSQRATDERQLARVLHGELDWIVMNALEKDRTRRYGSADALAADLQRYLDDQPVKACPPSLAYRVRKFVRRKRATISVAAILAVCIPLAIYNLFNFLGNTGSPSAPAMPSARAPGRELPGLVPEPILIPEVGRWQLITKKPRGVMRSAVWSPDENLIALGEANHVRIYDATKLQLLHVLVAHSQPVRSVAWHPDGKRLASASEDGTVRLWTFDGIPTHLLEGHSGPVYQVAWRPDGEQLASASADGTVRLWTADGTPVRVLDEGGRHVFGVDWSRDGRLLASVGGDIRPAGPDGDPGDNSLRVWEADSGSLVRKIDSSVKHSALCVDWRPDGTQLAVGYGSVYRSTQGMRTDVPFRDAGVRLWSIDGAPGAALIRDPGSESTAEYGTIYTLAWEPSGTRLAFGGRSGPVWIWNAEDQSVTDTQAGNWKDTSSISWKRDGSGLLATSRESMREWNTDQRGTESIAGSSGLGFDVVKWSPDGNRVSARYTATNLFWDIDGKPVKQPERPVGNIPAWWEVASQARRPDGTAVAALEGSVGMREWAWSKNGWLAGATWADATVRIWNDKGKFVATLKGHRGGVESVDWSPDGEMLASGGGDSVRLWKPDGTPGPVITGHTDEVYPVAWSPDGKWLASGSTDSTIRLWKRDGTPDKVLRGHQGGIHDIAWSPDSTRIASVSWLDSTLRVWNVATGKTEWQALKLDSDRTVTFTPSGQPLHGDPELLESGMLYLVEKADGAMDRLTFGDFRKRYATAIVAACESRCKAAAAKAEWRQAEFAFADALTLLPDANASLRNDIARVGVELASTRHDKLVAAGARQDEYARAEENINTALEIREALVAESPENGTFRKRLGDAYSIRGFIREAAGRIDEAIADGSRQVELNPESMAAHHNLGVKFFANRQYNEGIACCREAARIKPTEPATHHNLGAGLAHIGQLDEAISSLREAIRLKPDYETAHQSLARTLAGMGQIDEAVASYRVALRLNKHKADVHHGLGDTLYAQGQLDEAIACFREAIRLKKDNTGAHHSLGKALQAQGDLNEAIAMLRESVRLNSDYVAYRVVTGSTQIAGYVEPRLDLGHALYSAGQLDEAAGWYQKAVDFYRDAPKPDPRFDETTYGDMAWFLATCPDLKFRNAGDALDAARRAIDLAPRAWRARQVLGVCLYRAGDSRAAIEALQESMDQRSVGNGIDWFFLTMAHSQLGHKEEARAWYDKAVAWMEEKQPRNPELQRFRAEAAELLGMPEGTARRPTKDTEPAAPPDPRPTAVPQPED